MISPTLTKPWLSAKRLTFSSLSTPCSKQAAHSQTQLPISPNPIIRNKLTLMVLLWSAQSGFVFTNETKTDFFSLYQKSFSLQNKKKIVTSNTWNSYFVTNIFFWFINWHTTWCSGGDFADIYFSTKTIYPPILRMFECGGGNIKCVFLSFSFSLFIYIHNTHKKHNCIVHMFN